MRSALSNFILFSEATIDLDLCTKDWRVSQGGSELSATKTILEYRDMRNKLEQIVAKTEQSTSDDWQELRVQFLKVLGVNSTRYDILKQFYSPEEALRHSIKEL